jgi:hypothetical protein
LSIPEVVVDVDQPVEVGNGDRISVARQKTCLAYEDHLLQLAKLNIPNSCAEEKCSGTYTIETKMIGTAFQLTWVRP